MQKFFDMLAFDELELTADDGATKCTAMKKEGSKLSINMDCVVTMSTKTSAKTLESMQALFNQLDDTDF